MSKRGQISDDIKKNFKNNKIFSKVEEKNHMNLNVLKYRCV